MLNLVEQAVLGIVTGILTTVVLYGCKVFWDAKLYPFLRETRYAGVMIAGKWSGLAEDEDSRTQLQVVLNQSAFQLTGTLNFEHKSKERSYELLLSINGRIWEGYAILNFMPLDRRLTSFATALVKIDAGGMQLKGHLAFRDVINDFVVSEPIYLARQN